MNLQSFAKRFKRGVKKASGTISRDLRLSARILSPIIRPKAQSLSRNFGQPALRSYAAAAEGIQRLGQGVIAAVDPTRDLEQVKRKLGFKPLTPQGTFQRSLYGTNKPITLSSVGEEFPGVKKGSPLAAPIGFALGVSDLTPGGSAKRKALQKGLSKADDALKVFSKTGKKTRGFVESVKLKLPEAEKVAGQYLPRDTDKLAIRARNLVKSSIDEAERVALSGKDDISVATASELIKHYGDKAAKAVDSTVRLAYYDRAAEIANPVARRLTEQGRAVQAAAILGRLTPEGQLRFAAREIQRYNESIDAARGGLMGLKRKIPELSGQLADEILTEMKAIEAMPVGTEKAIRFQTLQNKITDLVPTPFLKKIVAVWKAGLLTGVKTSGLNIFSNLSHGASEVIKDIPAATVDSVASLFTGKRTKTLTTRGLGRGVKEGFGKGWRYFRTGFDERDIGSKLDYKRINFGKGKVARVFTGYTNIVFRALGTEDQPFYYGALARSLADQALAQGKNQKLRGRALREFAEKLLQEPTEEMLRYAVIDATTAVFQNETTLGKAAKQIQRLPGVGEFILPFARTPSAVATQIINYSPVGIAKTIFQHIGKGRFDQRLFSQGLGRGLTGTAIMAIGYKLAEKGLVTLDYPQGDEREQELQKAEGIKNNAIKINGKWRSPMVLGPAGNILLIGAHFQKALEKAGSPTEAISKAAFGGLGSFLDQTFVTGLKDLVNAVTDPERYAKSYLPNLVASGVPTLLSDIARAGDPLERRSEGKGIIQMTKQRLQARIPRARQGLEPQVDILGRERERIGNPLEVMFDPTRPSPETDTLVTSELRRLMDEGHRVSPTVLGDRQGYDALTQNQNTKLWKLTGYIVNDKFTALFADKRYLKLDDDEKAKVVEKFIDQAKVNARAEATLSLTAGLTGEALKEELARLKEGGLLTEEVFNKWKELR